MTKAFTTYKNSNKIIIYQYMPAKNIMVTSDDKPKEIKIDKNKLVKIIRYISTDLRQSYRLGFNKQRSQGVKEWLQSHPYELPQCVFEHLSLYSVWYINVIFIRT